MDARELMIGDWARIRYNHFETGEEIVKDFRVGQLAKLGLGDDEPLYVWSEKSNMDKVSKVEPIPLTPEILDKNSDGGFFYHDCPIIGYNGKRSTHHIGRASLYVEWERISMKPYIEIHGLGDTFYKNYVASVHELQHALRLCGIEKEIEI